MPKVTDETRTKTYQVADSLLKQIRGGKIRVGECIPSEAQLVTDLGVSRVTVRRAIRSLIRQGVLVSRPGVGHLVLSKQARLTIGIMVGSGVMAPFYRLMVQAFQDHLVQRGAHSQLYIGRPVGKEHRLDKTEVLHDIRQGRLGGLLTLAWRPTDSDNDQRLAAAMTRAGITFAPVSSSDMPAAVGVDHASIGYLGTRHFLDQGIERVGLICIRKHKGSGASSPGYKQAYKEFGHRLDRKLIQYVPDNGEEQGYHAMHRWRKRNPDARAVVISDDLTAKGVLVAAAELGLRIPDEFQVAAMSIRGSDLFYVRPFVRLQIDPDEIAAAAVDNLFRMIQDPTDVPEHRLMPIRVVNSQPSPRRR